MGWVVVEEGFFFLLRMVLKDGLLDLTLNCHPSAVYCKCPVFIEH